MGNQKLLKLTMSGMLIAVGLIIPMFSPIRIILEPASFTLASHVVIFIAMFISPAMAASVSLGTTLGFFFGGFPIIVVMRAATHVIFAVMGSFYLHNIAKGPLSPVMLRVFSFAAAVIHAVGEVAVVSVFFFGGNIHPMSLEQGFFTSVILLVGLGTVVHSMVDFEIARLVIVPLKKQRELKELIS